MSRFDSTDRPRVLVIGGGVAGAAFGAAVDTDRFDVTIAEKATFPRIKICGGCIGPPGLRCLDRLGVGDAVRDRSHRTDRWIGYADGRTIDIDLAGGGIAVCRSVLDPILIDAATQNGCSIAMQTAVRVLDAGSSDSPARVAIGDRETSFDLVVAASGLTGLNLTAHLPWRTTPHGPMGVGVHVHGRIEPHAIHMIIGEDGYVGLVQLPGDRIDIAAAVYPLAGEHPIRCAAAMMDRAGLDIDLSDQNMIGGLRTTPPLRRERIAAAGRLIAIGDAHRYVEPFTGEGMTWALQTGIAAAEVFANHPVAGIADRYRAVSQTIAAGHRRRCERLTSAIRYRAVRRIATWGLGRFPSLAAPIVRHLASD